MNESSRLVPVQTRAAEVRPQTFDAETRTVDIVFSTGAIVRRYSFWDDEFYDESLDMSESSVRMGRLNNSAPVLNHHARHTLSDQIGVVESARIENGEGVATLRLSGRPDVAGLVQDIRDRVIRNISVGYTVHRYEITREPGGVPQWRATDWEPTEISFVTVPADAGAQSRNEQPRQGFPCAFVRADSPAPSSEEPAMSETRVDPVPDAPEQITAEPVQPEPQQERASVCAAEIAELGQRHQMGERVAGWLRSNKTADQVRAEILNALADRGSAGPERTPDVRAGVDQQDKTRGAAVEALLSRARVMDPTSRSLIQIGSGNPFRSMTLLDMARDACVRAGIRTDGLSRMEVVGRAFTQGTSDFPIILENAMHKALQSAYAVAPDTWSRFCAIGSVSDFRAHNRYKTGSIGNLDALTELNEFTHKAIPDGVKESITAATKGNIITLSRQAIINDDLGAFLGLATAFGRAANRTVEAAVYAYLATNPTVEGGALFNTTAITTVGGHANLAGSGAAPSVDTIEAGRVAMAKQMDISRNDFLDLRPAIWVGPMATGGEARVINDAQYDPDTANKLQRPNKVRGLFRDVVDTPRITGTEWYMFADPADAPVIEVAFLDGQRAPYLESDEGFSVDGTRWKCRLDYGIAAVDYRGAYKNPGG